MLDFLVLAAGSLVAVLALPNEWLVGGWGALGFFFLLPVFWFTARRGPWSSAAGGVLWISLITLVSQSWLLSFHPGAFPLVWLFQAPWYALAFGVSSLLWRWFPRSGLWLQALWWTAFEFLRIQGFFAYPYSSLASAVWAWPVLYQSADLAGTSAVTFLLAWTSAWLAVLLGRMLPWTRLKLDLAAGLGLWAADLSYGVYRLGEPVGPDSWKISLVQQSMDPWRGGADAYEAGFERLAELSQKTLPGRPDLVVWSETAFVPSVEYHTRYHESPSSLRLVRRLESFLEAQDAPFLLGNDHREKTGGGTVADYNAVLAWDGGWRGRYEKNRLVPFTESFPYRDVLPWVYDWLKAADTHFWEPGREKLPLTVGGVLVGTPVCYEDAFPDGARDFAQKGARVLVNLTNDSWAPGKASRMQHLSLAVFRSVETRLPLVRAGNDGATASVSARGELLGLLEIGPPGVLEAEVRLGPEPGAATVYTAWGDWFAVLCLAAVVGACGIRAWRRTIVDKGLEL